MKVRGFMILCGYVMDTCAWTYTELLYHAGRPGLPLHSKAKMMLVRVSVGGLKQNCKFTDINITRYVCWMACNKCSDVIHILIWTLANDLTVCLNFNVTTVTEARTQIVKYRPCKKFLNPTAVNSHVSSIKQPPQCSKLQSRINCFIYQ